MPRERDILLWESGSPELVEAEERVVAEAAEVAVVSGSFLLSVHWALGAVHVQDDLVTRGGQQLNFIGSP